MKYEEVKDDDWDKLSNLIGKTVENIYINKSKDKIFFKLDDGKNIGWKADADCCSESWIEHITLPYEFKGPRKVESIYTIDIGQAIPTRQESDELYGVKIILDPNGCWGKEIYIEFRNSSNGYYGGSMTSIGEISTLEGLNLIKESF